jgi:hypothetical protein
MRWYLNDASLQGQFAEPTEFEGALRMLLDARTKSPRIRQGLRVMRGLLDRLATPTISVRKVLGSCTDRDLRTSALQWLDKAGPFVDDMRIAEDEDYFECYGLDVTDSGLGEAARATKSAGEATAYSIVGGACDFSRHPLKVDHGLPEERLGIYDVPNLWSLEALAGSAVDAIAEPTSWKELIELARERCPFLVLPDSLFMNGRLVRESFSGAIANSALRLMLLLDEYAREVTQGGFSSARAKEMIRDHFSGAGALFTAESETNKTTFLADMTFADPLDDDREIFAHWHGRIPHRFYRLHFEWPLPPGQHGIKVVYLGPKITKA